MNFWALVPLDKSGNRGTKVHGVPLFAFTDSDEIFDQFVLIGKDGFVHDDDRRIVDIDLGTWEPPIRPGATFCPEHLC